ncbi:MAG: hypothetical protein WKF43_14515 [Acidimicrobiales bacterium]
MPVPADAPVLDATEALLAPVGPGRRTQPFASGADCRELSEQPTAVECGVAPTPSPQGALVWLVEGAAPSGLRVTAARGRAQPVLEADDPDGQRVSAVHDAAGDLDGTPGSEIVIGFRLRGSGAFLVLDAVGGDGTVLFHRSLDHGRARVGPSDIEAWSARFGPEDPNCCPQAYVRDLVVTDGRSWRIAAITEVPADDVPAGQFP